MKNTIITKITTLKHLTDELTNPLQAIKTYQIPVIYPNTHTIQVYVNVIFRLAVYPPTTR